ncbi:MAG: contractile injection system tape measure protein [Bacteroidota bacterium]
MAFSHSIQKQVFDFTAGSEKESRIIQSKLSRVHHKKIVKIIKRILDEHSIDGKVIKIDYLSIDLGNLDTNFLESQISRKIENELNAKLKQAIRRQQKSSTIFDKGVQGEKVEGISAGEQALKALSIFFRKGRLPWWYPKNGRNINDIFLETSKKDPRGVLKVIKTALRTKSAKRRLILQLKGKSFTRLIKLLSKGQSGFIQKYVQSLVRLHKSKPWVKMSNNRFEEKVKTIALDFLITGKQSIDLRQEFKGRVYHELFKEKQLTKQQQKVLSILGDDLESNPVKETFMSTYSEKDLLTHFLKFGTVPFWGQLDQSESLDTFVLRILKEQPSVFKNIFPSGKPDRKMVKRMAYRFSGEVFSQLLEVLVPGQEKQLSDFIKDIVAFQSKVRKLKSGKAIPESVVKELILWALYNHESRTWRPEVFARMMFEQLADSQGVEYQEYIEQTKIFFIKEKSARSRFVDNNYLHALATDKLEKPEEVRPEPVEKPDAKDTPKKSPQIEEIEVSQVDLVFFFLEKGYLPWWSDEFENVDLDEILKDIALHSPGQFVKQIKLAEDPGQITLRLINRFSNESLKALTGAFFPEFRGFIDTTLIAIEQVYIREYLPFPFADDKLKFTWQTLMPILMENMEAKFGPRQFVSKSISGLAHTLNIKTEMLMKALIAFSEHRQKEGSERFTALSNLLIEILDGREDYKAVKAGVKRQATQSERKNQALEERKKVVHFLKTQLREIKKALFPGKKGLAPKPGENVSNERAEIVFGEITIRYPEQVVKLLPYFASDFESRAQLVKNVKPALADEIINLQVPLQKKDVAEFFKATRSWLVTSAYLGFSEAEVDTLLKAELLGYLMFRKSKAFKPDDFLKVLVVRLARIKSSQVKKVVADLKTAISDKATPEQSRTSFEIAISNLDKSDFIPPVDKELANLEIQSEELSDQLDDTQNDINDRLSTPQQEFRDIKEDEVDRTDSIDEPPPVTKEEAIKEPDQGKVSDEKQIVPPVIKDSKKGTSFEEKDKEQKPSIQPESDRISKNINPEDADSKERREKEQKAYEAKERKRKIREKIAEATGRRKRSVKIQDVPEGVEPESIYINNAGLVLLHPFLPMFFKMAELDMSTEEGRHRAAHLLQYIVYKQSETPEEELVLNKLLTGIPLEDPIPLGIDITKKETELADQIVLSAVKNWDVMKNTTVDNFRVTFLQREGRLIEEQERWVLRVDPSTYDLLLKTLPWGLGIIKLSWMEKMIHIEWI